MTNSPIPGWKSEASDASFSDPEDFTAPLDSFTRRIRWRNWIEHAAGVLVIAMFANSSVASVVAGEWLIGLSLALVVVGTIVVMWNLHRRASNLDRLPEEPCLAHLRRQYERQYIALRAVPVWYIGPLLPGVVLLYAVITTRVAEKTDIVTAIEGMLAPAAVTFGIFAVVIAVNMLAARALKRKIDELDALA